MPEAERVQISLSLKRYRVASFPLSGKQINTENSIQEKKSSQALALPRTARQHRQDNEVPGYYQEENSDLQQSYVPRTEKPESNSDNCFCPLNSTLLMK